MKVTMIALVQGMQERLYQLPWGCVLRDLKGENNHVVAIAGDAAFTCGITLEALNNISCTTKKFILILNDNEWSIAKM